jgi:hypothetical protein
MAAEALKPRIARRQPQGSAKHDKRLAARPKKRFKKTLQKNASKKCFKKTLQKLFQK